MSLTEEISIYSLISILDKKFKNINDNLEFQNISEIIKKIFNDLKKQSKDKFFFLFLIELETNVLNYILEYVKFVKLSKNTNFANKDSALEKKKFFIGRLKELTTVNIINLSNNHLEKLRSNVKNNKLDRKDLSIDGGFFIYKLIRILNNEFRKNGVLEEVSNYLKLDAEITAMSLELSSEQSIWWRHFDKTRAAPKTLYIHLDKELKNVKSIIYLSEVDASSGPFTVYPSIYENLNLNILQNIIGRVLLNCANTKNFLLSNYYKIKNKHQPFQSNNFREHYFNLPKELRFNSHFGWDIISESEEEKTIIANQNKIIGKPGTFVIFDGSRLLHSGGLVEKGERIALQIIFGKKINNLNFIKQKLNNIRKKIMKY